MSKTSDDGGKNAQSGGPTDEAVREKAESKYLHSWQLAVVMFSLCLGTFLMALDINIIGVAIPKITTVFNSLDDASWYAAAYLLTVTAFQPTMGSFYKLFSIRVVYFTNIAIFEGKMDSCRDVKG